MKDALKNKTVVVTGSSSGIGKAAAEILCDRGYRVIATVRNKVDGDKLLLNAHSHVVELDLNSDDSVAAAAQQINTLAENKVYALFNNAAFGQPGAVEDLSRSALRNQFETNVFGTHQLTCAILPSMLKQNRAHIIQCSSILGFIGMPMRGAYVASKFALEGLTDTMRIELKDTGVQVSLIEPGPIESRFRKNALIALKDNVEFSSSRHALRYKAALSRLDHEGAVSRFTLGPEAVIAKLIHALESPKAKARYYVTKPTYFMAVLKRFAPSYVIDQILLSYASRE